MAGNTGQLTLFGPPTVSVHYDGKMPRNTHAMTRSTSNEMLTRQGN
jgi:hypothetical protein